MKKFQTTYILLGVFLALLLIVLFFTSDRADRKRRDAEVSEPVLSERQIEKVDQIVFTPVGSESVTLTSTEDGTWQVAETLVDKDEEEKLTTALQSFQQGKMVSRTQENWDKYGVSDEKASTIVLKQGDEEIGHFYFGTVGPSYQSVYARRDADASVYLIDTELDDLLRYNADRWKNKHLFAGIDQSDLQAASIRVGEEKWRIRQENLSLEWLDGDTWKNVEDLEAFKTYTDNLISLKADGFEPDASKFTAADNAIALTLRDGSEFVVSVDKIDDNQSLVKITGQPEVFRFSSDLSARLKPDFLKKAEPAGETSSSPSTPDPLQGE